MSERVTELFPGTLEALSTLCDRAERRVTRIGPCGLTTEARSDGPTLGYWRAATCSEFCDAVNANGGLSKLRAWSTFTNMEWSDLGAPYVFTEWGTDDLPVAADGGHPDHRKTGTGPCRMEHAVFVPRPHPGEQA